MDIREELEKVLRDFLVVRWPRDISPMPDLFLLAQAILDKLPELVEIDKEEVYRIINSVMFIDGYERKDDIRQELAETISEAKGIIRVKEGK